jgi:hypothetical protein
MLVTGHFKIISLRCDLFFNGILKETMGVDGYGPKPKISETPKPELFETLLCP